MSKLIVISFEGMNFDLLTDWIEDGHLPNFKRLIKEGYIGEINCSRVPYEASGLTSAFSGLKDSEHGILSYWRVHNRDYIPKTWSSNDMKDVLLWNNEFLKEYKFGIVNVFGTHPVHEINGYLISYAMERTLRYSYPKSLSHELINSGLPYVQDMAAFFKNQEKETFINEVRKVEKMRHNVSKELLKRDVDIHIINYTCIDRLCHFYMGELRDNTIPLSDMAVFQIYKYCDSVLGDILKFVDKFSADLLLFSSVGFGHLKHFVEINPFLHERGFLNWGQICRQPDWNRTIAFESVQGSHGININRESKYVNGIVKENDYEDTLKEVIAQIKKMKNPYNDNAMFSDVVLGREFYNNNSNAPDIIVEPYDWEYVPYGDCYWADTVHRHSQTGWHRNKSIWGGIGPNISNKVKDVSPHLENIAATINHILGKPIKKEFACESLVK